MRPASSWITFRGLNPIGKCFMTGIGFNRVHNPHDRESAYTKSKGWGPRPGILVFGPGGSGNGVSVPPRDHARRASASTSTTCLPSNGASSPSIRASVSPPRSTRYSGKAAPGMKRRTPSWTAEVRCAGSRSAKPLLTAFPKFEEKEVFHEEPRPSIVGRSACTGVPNDESPHHRCQSTMVSAGRQRTTAQSGDLRSPLMSAARRCLNADFVRRIRLNSATSR